MPESRQNDGSYQAADVVAWGQERWRWIVAMLLVLFALWRFSGKRPGENGRYVLVKDDIPCQAQRGDDEVGAFHVSRPHLWLRSRLRGSTTEWRLRLVLMWSRLRPPMPPLLGYSRRL